MHRADGKRAWAAVAAVAVIAFAVAAAAAQGAPDSLRALADLVLQKGPDSQLPAHLSLALGINNSEQATAVKQAVMRDGPRVRTLNVGTANHDVVVMIAYDEQSHATKAYLVSMGGKLRRAVAYQAGAAPIERSATEAQSDFSKEVKFWTETAHLPRATQ